MGHYFEVHRPTFSEQIVIETYICFFEKHIYSILFDYLIENHLLSQQQWGFQVGKSTATAVAAVVHIWHTHLDIGKDVGIVFFDFKKAFDTVPHTRLLDKLSQLKIHPYLIDLIQSYLTERLQCVVINGATSEPVSVISGVPQGSVLGPLLFIIYVNALCELNLSSSCKLAMYADDLVLYKPITSECEWFAFQQDITAILSGLMSIYCHSTFPYVNACYFISNASSFSVQQSN